MKMCIRDRGIEEVLPEFLKFCEGTIFVAHNANFDMSFIMENSAQLNIELHPTYVDTVGIARVLLPHQAKHTLDAVAKTMGVSLENHHRAVDDAEATAEIFVKFIPLLEQRNCHTLADVNHLGDSSPDKMCIRDRDEHTAALDPRTAEIVMKLTDQIVREKKMTTVMVTHNLRYALEYGDRILMMHQGKIVLDKVGEEKNQLNTDEIMGIFNRISVECGN